MVAYFVQSSSARRPGVLPVALSAVLALGACNEHIFQRVVPITTRTVVNPKKIDIDRAADILFVIDNSGSMAEEQENLARNASSSSSSAAANACDASGFASLKSYVESNPGTAQEDWPAAISALYAECGFIERLQLFKNHFQIGVITTDLRDCDQPYGGATRTSVPERGCLQTSQQDPSLKVLRWDTPNLADKFSNIIRNIGTWGSPYEQGLKAMEHFLTPAGLVDPRAPAPGTCSLSRDCAGDLEAFLRSSDVNASGDEVETKLVVIFLTDEEDCSNDDTIDESVVGATDLCYSRPELLTPTSRYVSFLQSLKSQPELVSVALIAGLFDTGSGLEPSGCKLDGNAPSNDCDPARGNSVATCNMCVNGEPVCLCHPYIAAADCGGTEHAATNCCQADPAERYNTVAKQMSSYKTDTLCSPSYKSTLIAIANLVNETGIVVLSETPADPNQVVVQMRGPSRGNGEWLDVPRYDESTGEPAEGGWTLIDDNTRIKFFGSWVPQPGDEIQVLFLGHGAG